MALYNAKKRSFSCRLALLALHWVKRKVPCFSLSFMYASLLSLVGDSWWLSATDAAAPRRRPGTATALGSLRKQRAAWYTIPLYHACLHVLGLYLRAMALTTQCWKCRWRRVRCDSLQPACSKCTSRGLVCPGYSDVKPLRWRHQISQHRQLSEDSMSMQIPRDTVIYCP
jgi:hypothetical protein